MIKINLKHILKNELKLTQEQFAEKFNIPNSTVSRICNNSTMIRLSTLEKIVKAVGPDFNKIFVYSED